MRAAAFALVLAACAAPHGDPEASARIVATEARTRPDFEAEVKADIRADAQRAYGRECGAVTIPDRAFMPVEFTGGGLAEYAVLFGRVACESHGGSGRWQGTGGVLVQFWIGSGGPTRLVLEQQMHGFSVTERGLLTLQHGGYCPGGGGPNICVVTYAWNEQDRRFDVEERRYHDDASPPVPAVEHDYEEISR